MTTSALENWRECFGQHPPVGYVLLKKFRPQWVRFHYFTDHRRTPRTAADKRSVLDCLNSIAAQVFPADTECVAFLAMFGRYSTSGDAYVRRRLRRIAPPPTWLPEADFVKTDRPSFRSGQVRWRPGRLDRLFLLISAGKLGPACAFSTGTGNAFCPYEGGVDLFLPSDTLRNQLKKRFEANLPREFPGDLSVSPRTPLQERPRGPQRIG